MWSENVIDPATNVSVNILFTYMMKHDSSDILSLANSVKIAVSLSTQSLSSFSK